MYVKIPRIVINFSIGRKVSEGFIYRRLKKMDFINKGTPIRSFYWKRIDTESIVFSFFTHFCSLESYMPRTLHSIHRLTKINFFLYQKTGVIHPGGFSEKVIIK